MKDEKQCPDCENIHVGPIWELTPFKTTQGNGWCRHCKGTGELHPINVGALFGNPDVCPHCHGTGQCQTCGGTGYIYENRESGSSNESSSGGGSSGGDETGCGSVLVFLGLAVAAIVIAIWLAVNVVLPVLALNSVTILVILGVLYPKWRKIAFAGAVVGSGYVIFDILNCWLACLFVNRVVQTWIVIDIFKIVDSISLGYVAWVVTEPLREKGKVFLNAGNKKYLLYWGLCLISILFATSLIYGVTKTAHHIRHRENFENHSETESNRGDTLTPQSKTEKPNGNSIKPTASIQMCTNGNYDGSLNQCKQSTSQVSISHNRGLKLYGSWHDCSIQKGDKITRSWKRDGTVLMERTNVAYENERWSFKGCNGYVILDPTEGTGKTIFPGGSITSGKYELVVLRNGQRYLSGEIQVNP